MALICHLTHRYRYSDQYARKRESCERAAAEGVGDRRLSTNFMSVLIGCLSGRTRQLRSQYLHSPHIPHNRVLARHYRERGCAHAVHKREAVEFLTCFNCQVPVPPDVFTRPGSYRHLRERIPTMFSSGRRISICAQSHAVSASGCPLPSAR